LGAAKNQKHLQTTVASLPPYNFHLTSLSNVHRWLVNQDIDEPDLFLLEDVPALLVTSADLCRTCAFTFSPNVGFRAGRALSLSYLFLELLKVSLIPLAAGRMGVTRAWCSVDTALSLLELGRGYFGCIYDVISVLRHNDECRDRGRIPHSLLIRRTLVPSAGGESSSLPSSVLIASSGPFTPDAKGSSLPSRCAAKGSAEFSTAPAVAEVSTAMGAVSVPLERCKRCQKLLTGCWIGGFCCSGHGEVRARSIPCNLISQRERICSGAWRR
jgi:hypothetical protein